MKRFIPFYILLFFAVNSYSQTKPKVCISFFQENYCCDQPPRIIVITPHDIELDDTITHLDRWLLKRYYTYSVSDEMFRCIENFVMANMDVVYRRPNLGAEIPFQMSVAITTNDGRLCYSFLTNSRLSVYFDKLKKVLETDVKLVDKNEVKMITDAINRIPYVN